MEFITYKGEKYYVESGELKLNNQEINEISELEGLNDLEGLQVLNLFGNQIKEITLLESQKNLKILILDHNNLTEISGLRNLTKLEKVSLHGNQISEIDGLEYLRELKELNLSDNFISNIQNLGSLRNLEKLELWWNKVSQMKGFENLHSLKELLISGNLISKIEGIENLTQLEILDLSDNKIEEYSSLSILINLRILNLGQNLIKKIDGLENLIQLKSLFVYSNKISKIEHIDNLENLESLLLSDNQISKIENLENLKKLRSLSLGDNKISEIEKLDKLTTIEQLDLSGNRIKEIKSIETLESLLELDLANNKIEVIEGLEKLKKLDIIYLKGNKLIPPDDIWAQKFNKGSQIVHFCRRKRRGEIEHRGLYADDKTHSEKIEIFKKELKILEKSEFVNIGTHKEKENISWKQNMIFYEMKPYSKKLAERDYNIKRINILLIQLHSLKGIKPLLEEDDPEYNNKHFDFFIRHFWDYNEIQNNVLVYQDFSNQVSFKIDEFLGLCVKEHIYKEIPHLLIFPESSIPYEKLKELISFSIKNKLIIIGGLEHKKNKDNNYNNIAFIIDNGEVGYQIKQTPVAIKNLETKEFDYESITCQSIPRINIFKTSIGNIAIFICKDFLRLCDIISDWAWKNDIHFLVIPSLTKNVLPFHFKLLNIFNYTDYNELKVLFSNIGEYGGSEFFSIGNVKIIERNFRTNIRDNVGEITVRREFKFELS